MYNNNPNDHRDLSDYGGILTEVIIAVRDGEAGVYGRWATRNETIRLATFSRDIWKYLFTSLEGLQTSTTLRVRGYSK